MLCACGYLGACVHITGGKDRLKNRASPASRRLGVTLTRVLLRRRDAYNDARRDFAHERNTQYVIVRDVIPTTARRGHPCAIPPTSATATYGLCIKKTGTHLLFVRATLSRKLSAVEVQLDLRSRLLLLPRLRTGSVNNARFRNVRNHDPRMAK